jgi:hypothetical protein
LTATRVQFGVTEDARRAVFAALAPVEDARRRARLANEVTSALRAEDLLAQSVEQHYNARQVADLVSRHPDYIAAQAKAGKFGPVMRDDGGWLIPASGVQAWLAARVFSGSVKLEVGA